MPIYTIPEDIRKVLAMDYRAMGKNTLKTASKEVLI